MRLSLMLAAAALLAAPPSYGQHFHLDPHNSAIFVIDGFGERTLAVAPGPKDGETPIEAVCGGEVSNAADAHLFYTSGAHDLVISVESEATVTLLVSTPDGRWRCSAGEDGANPSVTFDPARSGRYGIWVGAIGSAQSATIQIQERDPPSADQRPPE
ncbi:MAG: hypothetical protein JNM59_06670 [Hyphomonadaceae bacterium]|nr:hypothetical protein [Hyphomonadaceae bacterium]